MPDKVKISELETTTSVTGSTYLAVDDGTTTKKITVDNYNSSANTTARGYALQSAASATEAAGQATAAANTAAEVTLSVNRAVELAGQAANSASAAAGSAANAHSDAAAASASASQASQKAAAAQDSAAQIDATATLARSWAVGGTNSRAGEDANNAKYWAERASNAAGGGVQSFNSRSGYVNPQSGDYSSSMVSYSNGSSGLSANNAQTAIDEVNTKANGKAATKHDSTGTEYGPGTSAKYGHVKLSDKYTASDGAAANSVGASSKAVNDAYTALHNITDGLSSDISTVDGRVTSVNNTLSSNITSVSNTSAGHYNELKGELTANGNRIYMDYKDGKYGINTAANRGADTFIPFKNAAEYLATLPTLFGCGAVRVDYGGTVEWMSISGGGASTGFKLFCDGKVSVSTSGNGAFSIAGKGSASGGTSAVITFEEGDTVSISAGGSGEAGSVSMTWSEE